MHEALTNAEFGQIDNCVTMHLGRALADKLAAALAAAPVAEPVGEVVLFGGDIKEISWRKGKLPPVGTKLYAAPTKSDTAPARAEGSTGRYWQAGSTDEGMRNLERTDTEGGATESQATPQPASAPAVELAEMTARKDAAYEERNRVVAALASAPAAEPVRWWNGCNQTVPAALRYLANNDRPTGGEQRFNAEHLLQLAGEIERMARAPLYAAPTPQDTAPARAGDRPNPMSRESIRSVLMAHGYTVKEGQTDLKPYVYEAAEELICLARELPMDDEAARPAAGAVLTSREAMAVVLEADASRAEHMRGTSNWAAHIARAVERVVLTKIATPPTAHPAPAQPAAGAVLGMSVGDPRNPFKGPFAHDGFVAGWNAALEAVYSNTPPTGLSIALALVDDWKPDAIRSLAGKEGTT